MEVNAWPGEAPLPKERRERMRVVLTLLGRCRLWLGEVHWRGLCEIWLTRSAQPDLWLRQVWLETLRHWLCFLDEVGFEADSAPDLAPPFSELRPTIYKPTEPGHLPFGFVKPWM